MSNVATDTVSADATGLAADILADDRASAPQPNSEVNKTDTKTENEPAPQGDKTEGDKPDESEPTDPKDPADEADPEDPKDEEPQTGIVIGNQTFATPEDAIKEAQRVIGHNANLAGDLARLESVVKTTQEQLDEALEANKEWEEWAAKAAEGKVDPKVIARQAIEEYENGKQESTRVQTIAQQVDTIRALPNFAQVQDVIVEIADQLNPLTKKNFTPIEAYEFACKHKGVDNLLTPKKPAPKAPEPPPRTAARPTGQGKGAAPTPKADEPDEADIALRQSFGHI